MKSLFILLYIFICLLIPYTNSYCQTNESAWIDSLISNGLALEREVLDSLKINPTSFQTSREKISNAYEDLLHEINVKKLELRKKHRVVNNIQKKKIMHNAEEIINKIIVDLITPLWMGGKWDFNGLPGNKPNLNKPIACGHFVQKIMKDSGFNIKRNRGTWLAYLAPKDVIQTFLGSEPQEYSDWDNLLQELRIKGRGVYIFGLECGWGHVLIGDYDGKEELLFIHAGPHPNGASVNYDDGKTYISDFCGDRIWFVKLDKDLVEKWLLEKPIIPCRVM